MDIVTRRIADYIAEELAALAEIAAVGELYMLRHFLSMALLEAQEAAGHRPPSPGVPLGPRGNGRRRIKRE
ncbi:hypothetical protein NPA31_005310 [Aurantimonas sp. MSK8Z-1]|uniref:hypothetical protein n=1 Tax=Mangrovibrevibacter kandeliae TaxID=2968473 RepID=UPI0021182B07|nr:hypothetical protein [Aurantimonas sp. MSK8Z-1]MCW4114380.1 hypothetical protein [Aurantimonas sp. MSK8Z-1]